MYPSLEFQISESITHAKRHAELCHLSGEGVATEGYDELIEIFEQAKEEVDFLRAHSHEYDEHGFCYHCGCDGNA